MQETPKNFKQAVLDHILVLLWKQWSTLGVSGYGGIEERLILDPEALLLATCQFGRYEARLFDEVADWLSVNGSFINIQRLKSVNRDFGFGQERLLSALGRHLHRRTDLEKWKAVIFPEESNDRESYFLQKRSLKPLPSSAKPDQAFLKDGWIRPPVTFSGKSQPVRGNETAKLIFRLRALFGVSARAEILAYLLVHETVHPSGLAQAIVFDQKSIQDILVSMYASELLHIKKKGREKHYGLNPQPWRDLLCAGGTVPVWIHWPRVFRGFHNLFEGLKPLAGGEDSLYISAQYRTLSGKIRDDLGELGKPWVLASLDRIQGESFNLFFQKEILAMLS
jgi:hypothetical protein